MRINFLKAIKNHLPFNSHTVWRAGIVTIVLSASLIPSAAQISSSSLSSESQIEKDPKNLRGYILDLGKLHRKAQENIRRIDSMLEPQGTVGDQIKLNTQAKEHFDRANQLFEEAREEWKKIMELSGPLPDAVSSKQMDDASYRDSSTEERQKQVDAIDKARTAEEKQTEAERVVRRAQEEMVRLRRLEVEEKIRQHKKELEQRKQRQEELVKAKKMQKDRELLQKKMDKILVQDSKQIAAKNEAVTALKKQKDEQRQAQRLSELAEARQEKLERD